MKKIHLILLATLVTSCNNGTTSSPATNSSTMATTVLPNGARVTYPISGTSVSNSPFTSTITFSSPNTQSSTQYTLSYSTPAVTGSLLSRLLSALNSLPSVTTQPSPCIVTGSGQCTVTVSPGSSSGNYTINSTVTYPGTTINLSPLLMTVTGESTTNTTYAYFVYTKNSESDSYTQCVATASGIESTSCLTNHLPGAFGAQTLSFNGNYAYFANNNSSSYTQCLVATNGIESTSCTVITPTNPGELLYPYQIAFNQNYAYIENSGGGGNYTKCSLGVTGIIESSSCNTISSLTPSSLSDPQGLALNASYAYFASNNRNQYTQCSIANGLINSSDCHNFTLPTASDYAQGLALSGDYAYFAIGGSTASYTQCSVLNDAIESSTCVNVVPSGSGALHNAQQVAIYGSYAYFANDNSHSSYYTQCSVSGGGIESASCSNLTPGAYESGDMRGISFYALP